MRTVLASIRRHESSYIPFDHFFKSFDGWGKKFDLPICSSSTPVTLAFAAGLYLTAR